MIFSLVSRTRNRLEIEFEGGNTVDLFGIHMVDWLILGIYFGVVLYLGVFLGGKHTKSLKDFFVAGSKWGAFVSFIFVFSAALAGNEAVVVSGKAYHLGLSGVWYWWNFLFATPVYYLFSTYYRRARVYNAAEFFEMRYGRNAAAFYALLAGIVTILFIGMILLAIGKILVGVTDLPLQACIWTIVLVVGAYVFTGGMMSSLLTGILQGMICIVVLGFVVLPFVWHEAGGLSALRNLPEETWHFTSPGMPILTILALNFSAIFGGIAGPWMLPWIAISKDEYSATHCAWGHLGKRIATVLFTFYGVLFALCLPDLADPEQAWGAVMRSVLPAGIGVVGLVIASFFAAAMSSVDTYATTSASMFVDYLYRKIVSPQQAPAHYLLRARYWAIFSIVLGAVFTLFIDSIADYVKIWLTLMSFLGVPIFFGVLWKRANRTGLWWALLAGSLSYLLIFFVLTGEGKCFANRDEALPWAAFGPTGIAIVFMYLGSILGRQERPLFLKRFYVVMNTPVGQEQRLIDAGILLPALRDSSMTHGGTEEIRAKTLEDYYSQDARHKILGADSSIELRRDPSAPWYFRGVVIITFSCLGLIVATWLLTRVLFVW